MVAQEDHLDRQTKKSQPPTKNQEQNHCTPYDPIFEKDREKRIRLLTYILPPFLKKKKYAKTNILGFSQLNSTIPRNSSTR